MSFSNPLYLLLLIPALAWLVWVARGMRGMTRARRRIAIGVRAALLLLLVLALAGAQSVRRNEGLTTLFLLDKSASMSDDATQASEAFIRKALEARPGRDKAGLIVFGKDPVIDTAPGSLQSLGKIYAAPDPAATDLAAAVRLASAGFGEGTARRVVLLSDGNETAGDLREAAEVAATDGVQIDVLPPPDGGKTTAEAVLRAVTAPGEVSRGEPFPLRVVVDATAPGAGVIRLDRDGVPVARVPVRLSKGVNAFTIAQTAGDPGFYRYRAVLETDSDADARNNAGMAFVGVRGRPRLLLIAGRPGAGDALARALDVQDLQVVRGGPERLPTRAEDLQGYDSLILSDVSADFLTDRQMRLIASAVRESGVGFGMIGGENSFLSGGYYGTPIADILPVDLNIRQRKVFPSTTILIVVDASGSMGMIEDGQEKIKIAATAAAATVRMMSPRDQVGIAGSTDRIEFVAPIQKAENREAIAAQAGKLAVGGGGIYIRPSLEFAYEHLRPVKTRVRHLILLADGADSDEQGGALELARRMVAEGMTISVVSIGDGKDVPFLKTLAAAGKGQFYLTKQARQLQRLFTRDASIMSRSAIEEGTFLPKVDPGDEVLQGIDLRSMPALHAYCLTGDRPLSRVPMRTAKDDPLLAYWQYGLGTSMAFTSDAQPRWARPWIGWRDFNAFWAQAARATLRRVSRHRLTVTTRREGGKAIVEVEAFDIEGNPINGLPAKATVLGPDGSAQQVPLRQTAPGRYASPFAAERPGSYIVSVAEGGAGGAPRVARAGFAIAYPPEYQAIRPNRELLEEVARTTGGQVLTNAAQAFRPSVRPGVSVRDLWPQLLLLAALLFPLDIAVRRLALPFAEMRAAATSWIATRLRRTRPAPVTATTATIGRLQAAKESTPRVKAPTDPEGAPAPPAPSGNGSPAPKAPPPGTGTNAAPPPSVSPLATAERLREMKRNRQNKD